MRRARRGCFAVALAVACIAIPFFSRGYWAHIFTGYAVETPGVSVPARLLTRLVMAWEIPRAEKNGTEGLLSLLEAAKTSSLLASAAGTDPSVERGERLPAAFYFNSPRDAHNWPQMMDTLGRGQFVVCNGWEYLCYARLKNAIFRLQEAHSVELMGWMMERSDVLPPRRLGTLISQSWHPEPWRIPDRDWQQTKGSWKKMWRGRNPVYRLSALARVSYWAEDWEEQCRVYVEALEEKNSVFHSCVFWGVERYGHPDGRLIAALERYIADETIPDNDGTVVDSYFEIDLNTYQFPSMKERARKALAALKAAERTEDDERSEKAHAASETGGLRDTTSQQEETISTSPR